MPITGVHYNANPDNHEVTRDSEGRITIGGDYWVGEDSIELIAHINKLNDDILCLMREREDFQAVVNFLKNERNKS